MPSRRDCRCDVCAALRDECGEHYPLYAKKLLEHSWAGLLTDVEKAYRRAHGGAARAKRPRR